MKHLFVLGGLLFIQVFAAQAQSGCTDPLAPNFNPSATSNDGSCQYPLTQATPILVTTLPADLQEISGFTQASTRWWGHEDSGADAEFYRINPDNGQVLQTIELKNAHNRDWEDIFGDNENLYLADVGNNSNNRQNLGIYTVPISAIGNGGQQTVQESEWSFLPFSYEDQVDFMAKPDDSSVYDCEGIVYFENRAHLFTKSRKNYQSAHYRVNPDTHLAEKQEILASNGLITGAALSPDGQVLALVGYDLRPFIPTVFCWLLWDWMPGTDLFFSGNKRRIELGSALQVGQVESIGFATNRTVYLSNERTAFNGVTLVNESVWQLDIDPWVLNLVDSKTPKMELANWRVFPNPFSQSVQIQGVEGLNADSLTLKNQAGQTIQTWQGIPASLDLSGVPPGVYVLECWRGGNVVRVWRGVKK